MKKINNGKINILTIGRFHVFEYARIFENFGILNKIISGYPKFKLNDEDEISRNKIIGLGSHSLYMVIVSKKFIPDKLKNLIDILSIFIFQIISVPLIIINRSEYLFILSKSGMIPALIQKHILKGKVIIEHTSTYPDNYNYVSIKESKFYKIKPQIIDKLSHLIHITEFRTADRIIIPTNYVKKTFVKYAKNFKDKLEIIPIPFNKRFKNYLSIYEKKSKSINSISYPEEYLKILSISQVTPRKGIKYLIDSLNYISKKYNLELTLIGNSSREMEKYLNETKKNFKMNWKSKVNHEEIAKFYKSSNIFILLSTEEGLPNVFKECIVSGLPLIGSHESGAEDLLNFNNCYCVNKDNKSQLLKTVDLIMKKRGESYQKNSTNKEIKDFNKNIINKWKKLLNNI